MFLGDLDARGLKQPELVIVDGAPGLEAALVALWGEALPIQRCTVHKHRNLLGHAPKHMHDELSEDYRDMIYADTPSEIEKRRKAFLRKWHLKCRAVADSLEECVFRGDAPTDSDLMRPPVPISSAHRFRGIRPPL
jgi:transposase-like protein